MTKKKNFVVINTSTRTSPDFGDLARILTRDEADATVERANRQRPPGTAPFAVYRLTKVYGVSGR